ncbi:hypothetical protein BSQ39_11550 [Loigolactobacillus backii]|uniref:hypothetical protein n=1 Tax=Loigolactobacillus backii TaxID=375175 RepID=UPI000C1C868B|nr:hypothetical protein [Loigolactobacillus backii]PIO84149.1 hypothetical protein BSQ39_11550 [Loigolactobacillus backii]
MKKLTGLLFTGLAIATFSFTLNTKVAAATTSATNSTSGLNSGGFSTELNTKDGYGGNYNDRNYFYQNWHVATGYLFDGTNWKWFQNGLAYTGFRSYMGNYYYFVNGIRQDNTWQTAWGMSYYTDNQGRAVQGIKVINNKAYNFGTNRTYNLKGNATGYLYDGSAQNGGYSWYQSGSLYTGFRKYMGAYYYFKNGVRQNNAWEIEWGQYYYVGQNGRAVQGHKTINGWDNYFGNNNTFFVRDANGKSTMPGGF